MWNGLYFISPPWKENQNNWCSVPPLHSVVENNSFCLGSKIFSHACKLHHPHLFFPVVKSLSAHPGLCIMEALPLSRSSDVFPWPAGQGWPWERFCFILSSPSGTCLLPCTSGHQLGRETLPCVLWRWHRAPEEIMKAHSIAGKTLLSAVKTQLGTISLQESRSSFTETMFRIFVIWL